MQLYTDTRGKTTATHILTSSLARSSSGFIHVIQATVLSVHYSGILSQTHFPTEVAGVFGVLRDFDFLHHLPKGGAIAGAVLTHYADLLRSFGLRNHIYISEQLYR